MRLKCRRYFYSDSAWTSWERFSLERAFGCGRASRCCLKSQYIFYISLFIGAWSFPASVVRLLVLGLVGATQHDTLACMEVLGEVFFFAAMLRRSLKTGKDFQKSRKSKNENTRLLWQGQKTPPLCPTLYPTRVDSSFLKRAARVRLICPQCFCGSSATLWDGWFFILIPPTTA